MLRSIKACSQKQIATELQAYLLLLVIAYVKHSVWWEQCHYEDGSAERRSCIFYNLLLYQGCLTYLHAGQLTQSMLVHNDSGPS